MDYLCDTAHGPGRVLPILRLRHPARGGTAEGDRSTMGDGSRAEEDHCSW